MTNAIENTTIKYSKKEYGACWRGFASSSVMWPGKTCRHVPSSKWGHFVQKLVSSSKKPPTESTAYKIDIDMLLMKMEYMPKNTAIEKMDKLRTP